MENSKLYDSNSAKTATTKLGRVVTSDLFDRFVM